MNSYVAPTIQARVLTATLTDVSTASQIYVVPGFACKIKKILTVLNGAITTADSTLTCKINGAQVDGGTITVTASGSAAGDVDFCLPTGANIVPAGSAIEIETNGSSSTAASIGITVVVEPIAQ